MKKILFTALFAVSFFGLALQATPPDRTWFTDASKGVAEAKEKNLPMLVLFTGSDWCGWCVKLSNDTLKKKEFKSYVKDKLVLLYLDYPSKKKLPAAITKQNEEWKNKYGVRGYPTVLIMTPEGERIGKLSYAKVDEFLTKLEPVLQKANQTMGKDAAADTKKEEVKQETPKPQGDFLTDYDEAMKIAKEKKLPVVMLFTGSDWCGWCIKLYNEALNTQEFKDFTAKEAVFLYLDFPNKKAQSAELKEQNRKLSEEYKVQGFPTTIVVNSSGEKLGDIGGYSKTYVKDLKKIIGEK